MSSEAPTVKSQSHLRSLVVAMRQPFLEAPLSDAQSGQKPIDFAAEGCACVSVDPTASPGKPTF
jgi:hypothetical protein